MHSLPHRLFLFIAIALAAAAARGDEPLYELRTYYAHPGKLEALHARFREHTLRLFEKHGMVNVGYWEPVHNPDNAIVYALAYPSRERRDAMWQAFNQDPRWQEVFAASRAQGPLVARVESEFLVETGFSPSLRRGDIGSEGESLFELRRYTASEGNLRRLEARFRGATMELFEESGMTNVIYWRLAPGQEGADRSLVYLLSHPDSQAAEAAWAAFGSNPRWKVAREASEAEAGGPLTAPAGVQRMYLRPTDYSPMR